LTSGTITPVVIDPPRDALELASRRRRKGAYGLQDALHAELLIPGAVGGLCRSAARRESCAETTDQQSD
jgi:hypothetical protein